MRHGVEPIVRTVAALLLIALAAFASAQDAGRPDRGVDPEYEAFRRMVDADPFTGGADDPIGRGDARDEEMRTMRLPEPEEVVEERIRPQSGAVLTAIPGVRESEHRVEIELRSGILIAREEIQLVSSARLPAEARYRLAVPDGGALVALEVCHEHGCRTGIAEARGGALSAYDDAARGRGAAERALPIAHAAGERDERGSAIVVRAAPVIADRAPLVVRVVWAVRAPVRGGRVRVVLPARGLDARAADARVSVRAIDLVAPQIDGVPAEHEETKAPGSAIAITAAIPVSQRAAASAVIVPCARGRCVRVRAVTGRPQIAAGDVVIAIDASPSTVAGARGRIAPTVRTLLSLLPAASRVRVVAFAARAEEVVPQWVAPTAVPSAALDAAVERELGSATRFEAIWAAIGASLRAGARIVIVGDGGLTVSQAGREALERARAAGVIVESVDVADRPPTAGLRDALGPDVVEAGAEAEEAAAGHGSEPLVARLTTLVAPVAIREVVVRVGSERVASGSLRAGEELVWERAVGAAPVSVTIDGTTVRASAASAEIGPALTALADAGRTALAAIEAADVARAGAGSCAARGPYATSSAVVPREIGLALAHSRRCEPLPEVRLGEPAPERESGLPARVLLGILRSRVIPPARACFRADRRGRGDYQERAEIRIELADREIVSSEVRGEIQPALRECLTRALDGLDVPGFSGRVIVTWPLYTAPTMPPPVLELAPEVASEVDRAIRREE